MHHCYSIDGDTNDESTVKVKGPTSVYVIPSAGARRQTVTGQTRSVVSEGPSCDIHQVLPVCKPHSQLSGLDRRAGLRWLGIEASELLFPMQFFVSDRILQFLNVVFCSVPQYRSYVEANGRLDVLAISLQLPFSLLQKLLPTRQTRNLLQHATALHIPKFLLLPQVLSVAATSLCLSEQLTEHLMKKLDVEKILSLVLVKMLEVWTYGCTRSVAKTQELDPIDTHLAPKEMLFSPSISFRMDAVSSISCVLALECYSQLIQRVGVCCRLFLSCDLQLISTLLACATSACMPNVSKLAQSEKYEHSNFRPRHAAFLNLRLASPLDVISQAFNCLRSAAKFSPAVAVLLRSPFDNYSFSTHEDMQKRLNWVIRTNRESFYLNPYAVWKTSCSILAHEFNHIMFSPFKLAIRWLKLIFFTDSRSHCYFQLYDGVRSPAHIASDNLEPEIFNALRTDSTNVESITFSCLEIVSLVSLTSEGRDFILADKSAIQVIIDVCSRHFEDNSLRGFTLTTLYNYSLQSTNNSLELLLRDYVLDFLNSSLGIRNVEILQVSLQIISNVVQRIASIGKMSLVMTPIFGHFWIFFQKSLCSRVVAAALHPVPSVMRSALCTILNSCAPGNPPKIRRAFASSGILNILHKILSHPQKDLKLLALGTVASVIDGDTIESLRWSEASSSIIVAGNLFEDKGQSAIDAHIRFMTMACIHNLSVEPLCWENGLDDVKVQAFLSSFKRILTLEAPK